MIGNYCVEERVGDRPIMRAYQLNARLKHMLLVGQDEDGELAWMAKGDKGLYACWMEVNKEEMKYENN